MRTEAGASSAAVPAFGMSRIRVVSEGATTAQILLRTVHDVDRYVALMRQKSDRAIYVGAEDCDLRLYDEWRAEQVEPRMQGTT